VRLIVSLLILGCIVSPAAGQWVYTTIQLWGLDSIHSVRFHSPNHSVYLGGDGKLIVVDAGTRAQRAGITLPGPVDLTCSITAGNKLYCASLYAKSLWVVDCATNQFTKTVSLDGRAQSMCYATGPNKAYVTCPPDSVVEVIAGTSNYVVARIRVPSWPSALCYNPELNRMYVAKSRSDQVAVIDCSADTVISTIWVRGVEPTAICYDSATNCVYTANHTSGTVSVIDCAGDSLVRVATVDPAPERVMAGPQGKVYFGGYSDSIVVVVDSLGTRTIPVGLHLSCMSFDPVNKKVYCAMTDSEVVAVDGIGDTVVARVRAGEDLRFTCYDPVDTSTWAARVKAVTIGVIDDASDQLIDTLSFVTLVPGAMCYSPVSNQLYCLAKCENDSTSRLIVVDGDSNRVLKILPTGSSPDSILWNPANNKVYFSNTADHTVSILECASDSITATVQTGDSPSAMCCSGNGGVYVTTRGGVTVIDPGGDTLRAVVPTPYDPTSLCYDRTDNKVYAVLRGHGQLCAIDAGRDSVVATVPVAQSSRQVCWNSNHDKVYVCAPADYSVAVIDCSSDTSLKSIDFGYWQPSMGYSDSACDKICVYAGQASGFKYLYNIAAAFDTFRWVPHLVVYNAGGMIDNGRPGGNNRLYCTGYTSGDEDLFVVSGADDSSWRSVHVGTAPTAVAWNPVHLWVYVANSGSSSISVVSDTMLGVEEMSNAKRRMSNVGATIVRGVLLLPRAENGDSPPQRLRPTRRGTVPIFRAALLDISGKKVMDLRSGANDVSGLVPGVYFVRAVSCGLSAAGCQKVVVTR
jgi:YVTN family beta-propeller protein